MKTRVFAAFAASLATATASFAQTTVPVTPPAVMSPSTTTTTAPAAAPMADGMTLNDQQAKAWIDKAVYSSDDKKLGDVAAFARDGSGKVTEMHADVGGFFGLGETRVRLMPAQFKLMTDRVILSMTADQAKTLPKIAK
jgi:hypothetical protein